MNNKTLQLYKFFTLLVVACLAISCDKDSKCLKTSGTNITEERLVNQSFESIELNNKINLIITQDSITSLKVEAGSNLMPMISTEIIHNQLVIKSDNKCSFLRSYTKPINVYLSTPNLKIINYKGNGDITATNVLYFPEFIINSEGGTGSVILGIVSDKINLYQHSGPADFTFVGFTKDLYVYSLGTGWFFLDNLYSQTAHVSSNGTGDVTVNTNNTLRVELRYIGNVNYFGNPVIDVTEHSGSGIIVKK